MKIRACLLLLVVLGLVWQSEGWWWGRRRRSSSTRNCSGRPSLPRYVTWSGCSAPYTHGEKCSYSSPSSTDLQEMHRTDSLQCPVYSAVRSTVRPQELWASGQRGYVLQRPSTLKQLSGICPVLHGTTPLFRRRRDVSEVFIWSLAHRVLMFRGEVFEWGVGASAWSRMVAWEGRRCPSDCAVSWTRSAAGHSTCTREQAEFFAREYKSRYGSYNLITNNCHIFVNRLMNYLDSGCTKMP